MTDALVDAASVARRLADALEQHAIPYAIGGAIAYGFYGAARGTKDVDVNLFLPPDEARPALDALKDPAQQCNVAANAAMPSATSAWFESICASTPKSTWRIFALVAALRLRKPSSAVEAPK